MVRTDSAKYCNYSKPSVASIDGLKIELLMRSNETNTKRLAKGLNGDINE